MQTITLYLDKKNLAKLERVMAGVERRKYKDASMKVITPAEIENLEF